MDKCYICGKPIQEGIQYLVDFRRIHLGNKPWCATPKGHYAVCEECDAWIQAVIAEERNANRQ